MPGSGAPRELRPSTIAAPAAAYAHGVVVPAGCDLAWTSGVVPTRADGSVPTDVASQADVVWAPVSGNFVAVLWSNFAPSQRAVVWQTEQSCGKPAAAWFGLVVLLKSAR